MSRSRILKPGTLLVLRGVTYRVLIQHEPDSVNIRNLQTHQDSVLQCSDVWNGWEDGDVQFFLAGEKLDEECEYNLHASSPVGPFSEDDTRPHAERAQSQLPIAHLRWDYPLTHPNQRVELQVVTLDLLILDDEHHLPLGQPTLAAIYDRYSGYPSGITVNFEPPSDLVAMECMYFAFRKKDEVSERLSTKHDYLAYGLPEVLVVDTELGKSSNLQQACHQLGIELLFQSTNDAWLVDVIGQWLQTMDLGHVRVTPGASLSCRRHHSDPDSEDILRMTFNRFWEALHSWIVDGYTQVAHQGVGGSPESEGVPAQLWQHALESNFFPRMPLKSDEFLALLPRTAERRIGYSGIVYERITYHSVALAALRDALIGSNRGVSVTIKFYSGDLSRIWVLDPLTKEHIEVEARDQQYASGLVLQELLAFKRYLREYGRRASRKGRIVEKPFLLCNDALSEDQIPSKRTTHFFLRDRYTGLVWGFLQSEKSEADTPSSSPTGDDE